MISPRFEVDRMGGGPPADAPRRERLGARQFDADEILDAIRRWEGRYGAPPTMGDWEPWRARRLEQHERLQRWEEGGWPTTRMVRTWFGSFNAAITAAGFSPRRRPSRQQASFGGEDAIPRAIREWVHRYGDVPTYSDWDPVRARRQGEEWRVLRYYDSGDWPSLRSVQRQYGTLSVAVEKAGLLARPRDEGIEDALYRAGLNQQRIAEQGPRHRGWLPELSEALKLLAAARREDDAEAIRNALVAIAAVALAWADLRSD
jgi:hypothetical protein